MTLISKDQKVEDVKFCIENTIKKTCIGRIIKLSAKAKDIKKFYQTPRKLFLYNKAWIL